MRNKDDDFINVIMIKESIVLFVKFVFLSILTILSFDLM